MRLPRAHLLLQCSVANATGALIGAIYVSLVCLTSLFTLDSREQTFIHNRFESSPILKASTFVRLLHALIYPLL